MAFFTTGVAATIGAIAAGVGATAALGGAAYSVHAGQMQKKEMNRQKSIAAEQMRQQNEVIAQQKEKAVAEEKQLQDELIAKQRQQEEDIIAKQRGEIAAHLAVSDVIRKRKVRGRRSLFSGSETGFNQFNTPMDDTLG
jgi:uncharacterized protein HemX